MNNRLKIVAILIFSVLSVVGVICYVIQQANKSIIDPKLKTASLSKEQPVAANEKVTTIHENFPEEVTGKMVGITPSAWIIDQPTGAKEFGIKIDTPVFKYEGTEKRKMSITDVAAGTEITAKLNRETGAILEAVIVK